MLDVQEDVRNRLIAVFPDIPITIGVPSDRPKKFVSLRREAGRRRNHLLDGPGLGIHCWAISEADAAELAEDIADFMETLPFSGGYSDVTQETAYPAPDPESKQPRWYMSYTLITYQPKG